MFFILQIIRVKKITHMYMQYAQNRNAKIIKMHGNVLGNEFLIKFC